MVTFRAWDAGGWWRPRWRRLRSRQARIPERWLLVAGSGFHSCPSPTARPWSASEMIKTKRILNVWNSLFTTDGICLFSLPSLLREPFASVLPSGPVCSELVPSTHQFTLFSFGGEAARGMGASGKGEGGQEGGGGLIVLLEISQKKKRINSFQGKEPAKCLCSHKTLLNLFID